MTITILGYLFNGFLSAIEGKRLHVYRRSGDAGRGKTITQRNQTRSWSFFSSLRPVASRENRPISAAEQLGFSLVALMWFLADKAAQSEYYALDSQSCSLLGRFKMVHRP